MWLFYKEKKYQIISLFVIILDGIIVYLIPSFFNRLNYFYPMLTIALIPFLNNKNENKYYSFLIIMGILYDLVYTNFFLYNAIIFLFLGIIDYYMEKYFKNSLILFIFLAILNIILYDSIAFLLVILTNYQKVSIFDLIYKIEHSILLNIMSVFVFFFIFKKRRNSA